jgi:osmotically-inducible protein OsmY
MRVILGLLLGFLIAMGIFWYLGDRRADSAVPATRERTSSDADEVEGDEVQRDVERTFDSDEIRDELARTGQVVREKVREAGEFVGEVAENAATTGTIKAKLLNDPRTSGLAIDVDTNDGVVTLSGKVDSYEEIARAMDLALNTDGVHKVVSALQVAEAEPAPVAVPPSPSP